MFFFFTDPATTEIYTLSLHDALPISGSSTASRRARGRADRSAHSSARHPSPAAARPGILPRARDRKSTRLNSSHRCISYAVFCLKKKKKNQTIETLQRETSRHEKNDD